MALEIDNSRRNKKELGSLLKKVTAKGVPAGGPAAATAPDKTFIRNIWQTVSSNELAARGVALPLKQRLLQGKHEQRPAAAPTEPGNHAKESEKITVEAALTQKAAAEENPQPQLVKKPVQRMNTATGAQAAAEEIEFVNPSSVKRLRKR